MPQRIWNNMFLDPGVGTWSFHQSNSSDYNKTTSTPSSSYLPGKANSSLWSKKKKKNNISPYCTEYLVIKSLKVEILEYLCWFD